VNKQICFQSQSAEQIRQLGNVWPQCAGLGHGLAGGEPARREADVVLGVTFTRMKRKGA
jgi:hypothetical protein